MSAVQQNSHQRGVSLIEALVALAVMAFGMLGVVGMQGSMRLNADIAKQRSEAVRIAQEAVENRRSFWLLDAVASQKSYADIASTAGAAVVGITSNTTFTVTETASNPPGGGRTKALYVDVSWVDRTGQNQNVRLSTNVTGNMPELSGALGLPALGTTSRLPRGRHAAIPPGAIDQGDGTSSFAPPGAGGVSWVFNNVSGFIAQRCEALVCSTYNARLLSGYVRFSTETAFVTIANDLPGVNPGVVTWAAHPFINGQTVTFSTTGSLPSPLVAGTTYYVVNQVSGKFELSLTAGGTSIATTNVGSGVHRIGLIGQPTSKMAESPPSMAFALGVNVLQTFPVTGTVACFTDAFSSYVIYFCAIPVQELNGNKWSGRSELVLAWISSTVADVDASKYKVCRYTPAATVSSENHPYNYADVNTALINQNFLVIRAGDGTTSFSCPADDTSTPEVNGNTLHHQPAA